MGHTSRSVKGLVEVRDLSGDIGEFGDDIRVVHEGFLEQDRGGSVTHVA